MTNPRNANARQGEGPAGAAAEGPDDEGKALQSSYHDQRAPSSPQIVVYSDGLCEPRNPGGWACWGWVAVDEAGHELASDCGVIGHGAGMTNNIAEYHAAIRALTWAEGAGVHDVILRTDSQLVVNQVSRAWACKAANLWPLLAELTALVAATRARVEWVPREQNARADALSRQAYAAVRGSRP